MSTPTSTSLDLPSPNRLVLTRQQVREVDRLAIEELGIPGMTLMENAGQAAATVAVKMLGDRPQDCSTIVVCGGGNNGGDGFIIARELHRAGVMVEAVALKPAETYSNDAATAYQRCEDAGLHVIQIADVPAATLVNLGPCDLIADAVFGTGLDREVQPPYRAVIDWINARSRSGGRPRVLAVDCPSGLDCDAGQPLGTSVRADVTVTFVAMKPGLAHANARMFTGELIIAEIGIPQAAIDRVTGSPSP